VVVPVLKMVRNVPTERIVTCVVLIVPIGTVQERCIAEPNLVMLMENRASPDRLVATVAAEGPMMVMELFVVAHAYRKAPSVRTLEVVTNAVHSCQKRLSSVTYQQGILIPLEDLRIGMQR
jgi:hypothetical protein